MFQQGITMNHLIFALGYFSRSSSTQQRLPRQYYTLWREKINNIKCNMKINIGVSYQTELIYQCMIISRSVIN